ncbi:MAG: transposase [Acidobacteriota bacterium]
MLLTEIGPDWSRFPTAAAFCSWLRLCPNPKISGGQVLSSRMQRTKNRAALALRMATQGLRRSDSFLGDYFRRMKARMGAPKAMTATAHKLAGSYTTWSRHNRNRMQRCSSSKSSVDGCRNQQDCTPKLESSVSNSFPSNLFLRRAGGASPCLASFAV